MSKVVDADFPPELRARLLDEIRSYLPAFLHRGASEQPDPAGDVRELLNLEPGDLRRVVAVHECLDEAVLDFGRALADGLRYPDAASARPPEVRQSVRGPVDWSATVARRSLEAGNPSLFVVRGAQRVFDTPENRALVWLLDRLQASVRIALPELAKGSPQELASGDASAWAGRIRTLAAQIQSARRVVWLRGVRAEAPARATLARLQASRNGFYARKLAPAVRSALALCDPSTDALADVLCKRYFEPLENWLIFEVHVALSLSRAFAEASGRPRKMRLLVGGGRSAFASFAYDDGSEVALIYQAWPPGSGQSVREEVGKRHALSAAPKRPDFFIVRSGPSPDAVVLELKASSEPSYLADGLTQVLGYLGEKPQIWRAKPSGWLVAPASTAFRDELADEDADLWIVSADRLAAAAVARFVPA